MPNRRRQLIDVALVAVGGTCGATLRYAFLAPFPAARSGFPAGSLVVNCIGAMALGLLLGFEASQHGAHAPRWFRPFLIVGVLGSFTTLSLVAVDHAVLITTGRSMAALLHALVIIAGTIAIALAGIALGTRAGGGVGEGTE